MGDGGGGGGDFSSFFENGLNEPESIKEGGEGAAKRTKGRTEERRREERTEIGRGASTRDRPKVFLQKQKEPF